MSPIHRSTRSCRPTESRSEIRSLVDAEVRGGVLENMTTSEKTISNVQYVYAEGDYSYLTPEYPANSSTVKSVRISSDKQIVQLYALLLSKAVRENCDTGSKGMIYPYGDITCRISGSKVTLESKFIISQQF